MTYLPVIAKREALWQSQCVAPLNEIAALPSVTRNDRELTAHVLRFTAHDLRLDDFFDIFFKAGKN